MNPTAHGSYHIKGKFAERYAGRPIAVVDWNDPLGLVEEDAGRTVWLTRRTPISDPLCLVIPELITRVILSAGTTICLLNPSLRAKVYAVFCVEPPFLFLLEAVCLLRDAQNVK